MSTNLSPINKLTATIAASLGNLSPKVEEKVIETLVAKTVEQRANAISEALTSLDKLEKTMYRLNKPDVVTYNLDGTPATQSYSSERLKEKKENDQKIEKLQKHLTKALEHDDYADLFQFVGSNKG